MLAVPELSEIEAIVRQVVREEIGIRVSPKTVLTKRELAEQYGWSYSTINRKMRDGMPRLGAKGEHPRFRASEVNEWLKSQR